jgi:hypothetical protein
MAGRWRHMVRGRQILIRAGFPVMVGYIVLWNSG